MPNIRTAPSGPARDPRGPFVFDLRSLSRQAGSSRTETTIAPAPADLRLELARVPEGCEVELQLKFESVTEGVLVTGSAVTPMAGECARCLEPVASTVTVSFLELYRYSHVGSRAAHVEPEEPEHGDEVRLLDGGGLLDFEPAFRDAVVLALPMSPLCRDDCPGLCVECGIRLAEAGSGHDHANLPDPRWAGLKQLQQKEG